MKKFLNEFKEFALKGNVMNLAVGVIIGGAFQGVVSSLTENILSPIIGLFSGKNFDSFSIQIMDATISYGAFITSVIDFLIMALVVFLIVRSMNKLMAIGSKHKEEEPAVEEDPTTKACPFCCSEIDLAATRCPHCTSQLPE